MSARIGSRSTRVLWSSMLPPVATGCPPIPVVDGGPRGDARARVDSAHGDLAAVRTDETQ